MEMPSFDSMDEFVKAVGGVDNAVKYINDTLWLAWYWNERKNIGRDATLSHDELVEHVLKVAKDYKP
jgi:hypothetical protein